MLTALFDGYCVICQSTRAIVNKLDWFGRIEFLDLHNRDVVAARYPHLDHDAMMGEVHVVTQHGNVYAGFRGTRRMLRELPLGLPLWALLHLPGMNWLGPRIYGTIARHRYAINRLFGVELAPDCDDGTCNIPAQRTSPNA